MKRPTLALLVLAATVASLAVAAWAGAAAWNHDPGSAIGPAHWGTIDPAFARAGRARANRR